MSTLVYSDRALLPGQSGLSPAWVEIDAGRIVATGAGAARGQADVVVDGGRVLTPGFVDVHSHGGGGAAFGTDDPRDVETVLATHRAHGTTTMIASLVTAPLGELARQVALLAEFVRDGRLAGIHLEGPWLSQQYKGAHEARLLADPTPEALAVLLDAGEGCVRMVTLAPERPGALDTVRTAVANGCVVAIGHTAADIDQATAAVDAGATGATHLFNAMPPMAHRAPGPVLALWHDPRVWVELICDGIHVDRRLIAWVMATAPERTVLVTDAMAAAGSGDGDYLLGDLPVEVRDGVARLAGQATIAGSTLTLDRAVRVAVAAGVPVEQALRSACEHPADYLSLLDVGRLAAGQRADLVVLTPELDVERVMWRGEWVG